MSTVRKAHCVCVMTKIVCISSTSLAIAGEPGKRHATHSKLFLIG